MYHRDNRIMRKLLGGKAAADNSTDPTTSGLGITSSGGPTSAAGIAAYRPSASQNTVYPAGVPILCVDASPDRRTAVLAGRHILKTVRFGDDGLTISEGIDLRAVITAQPITSAGKTGTSGGSTAGGAGSSGGSSSSAFGGPFPSVADQLSIRDVKWHGDSVIFTACANGKIFSYDLTRVGAVGAPLEYVQAREDSRQVNTLDINPHRQTYLLSGSQDGVVRFFDVRVPQMSRLGYWTYRSGLVFKCNEAVRHVKWSPNHGFTFACGTEAGVVLKWDIRRPNTPELRINAHEKACASISWHPDGEHLISGGWDGKCAVWDLSASAERRQKPKWSIQTPAPVAVVAWRPGLWSATAQGRRAAQVAVAYDDSSQKRYGIGSVHIWDLARPSMPFKEIERFDSSPTALLWHDQDLLWTVGQDGLFNQCDVAYAPKVIDRQSLSSIAFSSRGDVALFLDERPQSRRPRPSVSHPHPPDAIPRSSYNSSPTTPMLSISRSDSEEDVVGSFLGPRRRLTRKRRASTRSVPAMSTTPPSASGMDEHILPLEQALKITGIYKTQQTMAVGHVPAAMKVTVYQYLSSVYLETLERELPSVPEAKPLVERVGLILETYARAAESVSLFRLAQTWRILGYAMNLLLQRRAQYHLETRLQLYRKPTTDQKRRDVIKLRNYNGFDRSNAEDEDTPRKPVGQVNSAVDPKSLHVRSLLAEEIESSSNVATPLAKPVSDDNFHHHHREFVPGKMLTPVLESDSFTLPPAVHSFGISPRRRLDSEPISIMSHDSEATQASTEGYDFYDTESLSRAIDVPGSRKHDTRTLDFVEPRTPNRGRVLRQNSDESYGQMFSISNGSRQMTGLTSSSDGNGSVKTRNIDRIPEHDDEGDSQEGEYESRIRGKGLDESPEHAKLSFPSSRRLPRTDSPEEVFMISQTTIETDTTVTSVRSQSTQAISDSLEAEMRINTSRRPSRQPSPARITFSDDLTPTITEADYFPWPDDPPYPHPIGGKSFASSPPLDPCTLVTRALEFESRTSALNAAAIVLLLRPLLPRGFIDFFQANAVLRQYHSRLMGMQLFVEAALLRNLCVRGWPEGLPHWGDDHTAIFGSAQQTVKVSFFCSACRKPRDVDPQAGDDAAWTCERCRSVMAPCSVCGHRELTAADSTVKLVAAMEGVGVSGRPEPMLNTWWYCHGCGHGGHATCLQAWHAPSHPADGDAADLGNSTISTIEYPSSSMSEGCCALDGCGHACLPGRWQAETRMARSEELGRVAAEKAARAAAAAAASGRFAASSRFAGGASERRASGAERKVSGGAASVTSGRESPNSLVEGRVSLDGNDVPQSRAVASVRETLASGAGSPGSILSSSPGRTSAMGGVATGERERRKSVKFVGN